MKREVAPARSRSPSRAAAKHGVDYCIPDMPGDFNDLAINSGIDAVLSLLPKAKVSLKPVPFDPLAEIPPRPWLFGDQLIKGYVSVLVAPPGVGKSTFTIQIGIAVAMGMDWADWHCHEQGNVWLFNNEDDRHELYRRVHASCLNMGVAATELEGKLFINTGDERPLLIARGSRDQVWLEPDIEECISYIREHDIKLFIVDPFAETHTVNENSNDEIKQVAAAFRRIAKETGCAINLVHHTRKGNGLDVGGNMDVARGASALRGVARVAATLFSMRKEDAKNHGLNEEEAHLYVRHDGAKGVGTNTS